MRFNTRYGFFSLGNGRPSVDAGPFYDLLEKLDRFVEANHKRLLIEYRTDPIRKTALLKPLHHAKTKGNLSRFENYLENFIRTFKGDKALQPTTAHYERLLLTYQKTKTVLRELNINARQKPSHSIESLVTELKSGFNLKLELHQKWLNEFSLSNKPSEEIQTEATSIETMALTKQQTALEQLKIVFMDCIRLRMLEGIMPHHPALLLQNYYPAKLSILLHGYEKQYHKLNITALVASATQAFREEQEEAIRAKHLDAVNELEKRKVEFNEPRYQRKQDDLQQERADQLNKLKNAVPQLTSYATKLITRATDNNQMKPVFEAASEEVARNRITLRGGPALFNAPRPGNRRDYEQTFITPLKTDDPSTMSAFAELFHQQCATVTSESQAAPAA